MPKRTPIGVVAVLLISPLLSGGATREWPTFHGPERDNISSETSLLKTWPSGGPKLLWTAAGLGKGYSSVTVAGGMIYTAGRTDKQTYVYAFDLAGKRKWRKPNGQSWDATRRFAMGYAGSRGTPTYDNGRVYHLGELGRLACLDAIGGEEKWSVDLFKRFDAKTPKYGLAESVLIEGDRLICCPGGKKAYMVCLNKNTGKLIWKNTDIGGTVGYSSLVPAQFGGFRLLIGMSSNAAYGVDAATGKLLWSVPHKNMRNNNATDPIFHKGHVFASSGYGKGSILIRLKAGKDSVTAEKLWDSKLMDNHHGGVVRVGEHVYGSGHQSRGWFCLDFMTGKQAWNAKGKGSLTVADGMLYCLDEAGRMSLVQLTPAEHREVSSFDVPSGGRGKYWAHPVVCDGRLYLRHADKLYAYDIRAK